MNTKHYMTLLRCITDNTTPPKNIVSALSLDELYHFASLNKLESLMLPLLSAWLAYTPEDISLINNWRSNATAQVFLEYKKNVLLTKLLQKAKEHNLTLILFKGCVLADLYKDFTLRSSSDTDILIAPEDLQAAKTLLKELNYFHAKDLDTKDVYTFIYEEDGFCVHKIELHTALFEDADGPQLNTLNSLQLSANETLIPIRCCNLDLYTLGHTQHFIYQIFHMVKHLCYYGLPARYLTDIALFIRRYHSEIDWGAFHSAMNALGYTCFCNQLFSILIQYFALQEDILGETPACTPEDTEAILEDILSFGARSFEEKLGSYFFYFETYIERLENQKGKCLNTISFDGSTVPEKVVPLEYQNNKKLQCRIHLLRHLQLI